MLKKCFDGFCQDGSIHVDTIGTILTMMGLRVKPSALKEIIEEVDEDGSGYLEFEEFCSLRCKKRATVNLNMQPYFVSSFIHQTRN